MMNSDFTNKKCADILARAMYGRPLDNNPNHYHNHKEYGAYMEVYAKDKDAYDKSISLIRDELKNGFNFEEIARMFVFDERHTVLVEYQITTKECIDANRECIHDVLSDWMCAYKVGFVGDYTADDNKEVAFKEYKTKIEFEELESEMTKLGIEALKYC